MTSIREEIERIVERYSGAELTPDHVIPPYTKSEAIDALVRLYEEYGDKSFTGGYIQARNDLYLGRTDQHGEVKTDE